jgi:hypothetical protein
MLGLVFESMLVGAMNMKMMTGHWDALPQNIETHGRPEGTVTPAASDGNSNEIPTEPGRTWLSFGTGA